MSCAAADTGDRLRPLSSSSKPTDILPSSGSRLQAPGSRTLLQGRRRGLQCCKALARPSRPTGLTPSARPFSRLGADPAGREAGAGPWGHGAVGQGRTTEMGDRGTCRGAGRCGAGLVSNRLPRATLCSDTAAPRQAAGGTRRVAGPAQHCTGKNKRVVLHFS